MRGESEIETLNNWVPVDSTQSLVESATRKIKAMERRENMNKVGICRIYLPKLLALNTMLGNASCYIISFSIIRL